MMKEEAFAYLGEEWEDAFEDEIFALKQQLLSILPVHKLYRSKLKKWGNLEDAYRSLGGRLEENEVFDIKIPVFFNEILSSFSLYQEVRNQLKLNLLNTFDLSNAEKLLQSFVKLEVTYASLWLSEYIDENVIVSKIPDPMEVWNGIKIFESIGGTTFDDLKEMSNEVPETLKREQKRLTLYYTKYGKNE